MIKDNIKDYVRVYKNFFNKKFCKDVVAELQNKNWETHSFYMPDKNEYVSFEDDLAVSFNHQDKKSLKLNNKIWDAINRDCRHAQAVLTTNKGGLALRF